jgi:hypothetical protein
VNEEEEQNSFELFQNVVLTAIKEKEAIPKWKKKLDNTSIIVNFKLLLSPEDIVYTNLLIEKGSYSVNKGKVEDAAIEIVADPMELMWYVSKNKSLLKMFTTGVWKIKKLWRYPFKALFIARLLLYD